ncbi:MAG: heavy metal translocating P-type ATPase [Marinovum algicola]|uniref:heavy metal translocating P-type ATPase n=1 Tax=Alphaproteobacteria TaxID=28211 RepID=UPI0032EC1FBA
MSCCAASSSLSIPGSAHRPDRSELLDASHDLGDGRVSTRLAVPDAHCAGCIAAIEKAVGGVEGVEDARVNLAGRFVTVKWTREAVDPEAVFAALDRAGYRSGLMDMAENGPDPVLRRLFIALAVAGFAAGNVMLLSVSIWSGADAATRDLFHWISAGIAIPAVAVAGRPFFAPALHALRAGRLNMDVPISLAVILAVCLSIHETVTGGMHAYFDASVTLLFFLLIGRTLDHVMRSRAGAALRTLDRTTPRGAVVIAADGTHAWTPIAEVAPGMTVLVASGDRVPVDGTVTSGGAKVDLSIVTGESDAVALASGDQVVAGALVIEGPLSLVATKAATASFLGEMRSMLEAAETSRPALSRLADRAAAIYAPAVHLIAAGTFAGWWIAGDGLHHALTTAIAVLIITCPCALGLAAPIVQVVAAGRLLKARILLRDGGALEALATVDRVVLDKTGTLTIPTVEPAAIDGLPEEARAMAAALSRQSRHPVARAIEAACTGRAAELADIREEPGHGVEGSLDGRLWRLGRADWALAADALAALPEAQRSAPVLASDGRLATVFEIADRPRPGADEAVAALKRLGLSPVLLSGDGAGKVAETAARLGLDAWSAGATPADKIDAIRQMQADGHRVLMVGDGLNDAPALAAADVSMAPSAASDVSRSAAAIIFLSEDMNALPSAISVARKARRLILQNFGLALVYNAIAIPLSIAGYATPLFAAIAMSASSVVVVANALRLALPERDRAAAPAAAPGGNRGAGLTPPVGARA